MVEVEGLARHICGILRRISESLPPRVPVQIPQSPLQVWGWCSAARLPSLDSGFFNPEFVAGGSQCDGRDGPRFESRYRCLPAIQQPFQSEVKTNIVAAQCDIEYERVRHSIKTRISMRFIVKAGLASGLHPLQIAGADELTA